jgi:hypothetical protein
MNFRHDWMNIPELLGDSTAITESRNLEHLLVCYDYILVSQVQKGNISRCKLLLASENHIWQRLHCSDGLTLLCPWGCVTVAQEFWLSIEKEQTLKFLSVQCAEENQRKSIVAMLQNHFLLAPDLAYSFFRYSLYLLPYCSTHTTSNSSHEVLGLWQPEGTVQFCVIQYVTKTLTNAYGSNTHSKKCCIGHSVIERALKPENWPRPIIFHSNSNWHHTAVTLTVQPKIISFIL